MLCRQAVLLLRCSPMAARRPDPATARQYAWGGATAAGHLNNADIIVLTRWNTLVRGLGPGSTVHDMVDAD
jgi:hypothetical protein